MSLPLRIYLVYALGVIACLTAAWVSRQYWVAGLPLLILLAGQTVLNFRPLFWLLLVCIPLGTEVALPGGLGTDLPTEPLAIGLTGVFFIHAARYWPDYRARAFLHPIALLLYGHVCWILFSTVFSTGLLISLKFSAAKLWYVGAFFLLPLLILDRSDRVALFVHCIFWPLLFVAVQTLIRHGMYGFSFADQFRTMHPFMRNHVSYAGCLTAFTPWFGFLIWRRRRRGRSYRWILYGLGSVWLLAIFLSYTRAAYVTLLLAATAYLLIRARLMVPAVGVAILVLFATAVYFVRGDRYLEFAPNYETTVSHYEFDDLISATYQLEDVSTMERLYRWVAGGNMVPYRPWTGFGPGNFVERYRGFTNNNFETYVSDNPERSGIHNYYLMTLVEQGYPGLLILLALLFGSLLLGERLYHRHHDPEKRAAIMAGLLCLVVVDAFSLINDVLETDKMGSLFFLSLAVVVSIGSSAPEKDDLRSKPEDRHPADEA